MVGCTNYVIVLVWLRRLISVAKGCHRIRPVCSKCPRCICKDYGSQLVCRKMLCSKILASFVDTTSWWGLEGQKRQKHSRGFLECVDLEKAAIQQLTHGRLATQLLGLASYLIVGINVWYFYRLVQKRKVVPANISYNKIIMHYRALEFVNPVPFLCTNRKI